MSAPLSILITCEHGGNTIPKEFLPLFLHSNNLLASHRGYDPGALELASNLAKDLQCPLFYSTISRLLIELNRSSRHKSLFSQLTKTLDENEKKIIFENYYLPYRQEVEKAIEQIVMSHQVLHLSIHSFTPELNGRMRNADVGFLYDSSRRQERNFCFTWRDALASLNKNLRLRMNYPYTGKSDGFTTYLRKKHGEDSYLGIELEVNQKFPLQLYRDWNKLKENIIVSLKKAIDCE